jgi:hypothetical protein
MIVGGCAVIDAVSPKTKRGMGRSLPASLLDARLCELFWREPDVEQVADIEQRIANVLRAALRPEPLQLFDDLYELATC